MFGSKKDKFAKGGHTLFDHALEVDGNVRFSGILDVEGTINGDICSVEGSEALIRIRDRGCVNGDIRAPKILINGCVNGNVFATTHLELAAKAEVNGNVNYHVIEMVKGAQVNGSLVHLEENANTADGQVAKKLKKNDDTVSHKGVPSDAKSHSANA